MRKRTLARMLILAALFQVDVGKVEPERALDNVLENLDDEILETLILSKGEERGSEESSLINLSPVKKILKDRIDFSKYFEDRDFKSFIRESLLAILNHLGELDVMIAEKMKNWNWDRVARVEKNIMRMALAEMIYREDIPVKVSIDEAIELAKIFGDRESGRFVNGILGAVKINEVKEYVRSEEAKEKNIH